MPARKSALIALVLIVGFVLCLPFLELIDCNDLVLTGQDLEISILDMLTIFCVWFILVVRLLAFVPRSWGSISFHMKAPPDHRIPLCNRRFGILLLPDEPGCLQDSLPLLI